MELEGEGDGAGAEVQIMMNERENNSNGETHKRPRLDIAALPTRQYLDQAILPVLIKALSLLNKERPAEPLEWLAAYLLKQKQSDDLAKSGRI